MFSSSGVKKAIVPALLLIFQTPGSLLHSLCGILASFSGLVPIVLEFRIGSVLLQETLRMTCWSVYNLFACCVVRIGLGFYVSILVDGLIIYLLFFFIYVC